MEVKTSHESIINKSCISPDSYNSGDGEDWLLDVTVTGREVPSAVYVEINNNSFVPSVTSILNLTKPSFLPNSKKINNDYANASSIGNLMHKYLDYYVSRNTDFFDENKNFQIAKNLAKILMKFGEQRQQYTIKRDMQEL